MQTLAGTVRVMQSHQGNHCALATQQHGRIGLKQAAAAVCCCVSSRKALKNLIQSKHHVTDVQGRTMSDCSAFACAFRKHIPLPGSVSVRSIASQRHCGCQFHSTKVCAIC
ncbi:TPA: hypothetical protein ACH3X3_014933 [Trebouxia sp. C0006]